MKSVTKTTPKTETVAIKLTTAQLRRIKFVADEIGCTVESMIADAAVDQCESYLEDGFGSSERRDAERSLATRINRRAA